jgi:hypothetical protein
MSAQLSLTYRPAHAGAESWQLQLEVLRAVVEHLGRKEVAFELDVTGSALGDALHERDRKRWAAEWSHVVKAMLAQRYDDVSRELLSQLCETDIALSTMELVERRTLTPEEMVKELRRELVAMGATGQAAIDRVLLMKGKRK